MNDLKKIVILGSIFLFIGVSFSDGIFFKKNKVAQVIEYDEITPEFRVRKRHPASKESRSEASPSSVEVSGRAGMEVTQSNNSISPSDDNSLYENDYQVEEFSSHPSSSSFGNTLSNPFIGRETALNDNYESSRSRSMDQSNPTTHSSTENSEKSLTAGGGFFIGNATPPSSRRPAEDTNRAVSFKVHSITIKNGELILTGENLSAVKKISVQGDSSSKDLIKVSSTSSKLVAMGVSGIKMAMGQIYNLVVSDAYASSTFPIEFEIRDGSITPRKLAPLGSSEDGFVLKWDSLGRTWVAAPDEVGAGPDGGIISITRGEGIKDTGTEITTTGIISVDVGTDIHQIPQFDENKKLYFESDNALVFSNNDDEEFSFGISDSGEFEFIKQNALGAEVPLFRVEGNDIIINGQRVCLSGGDNCPTTGGDYVSTINVSPPLIASGTKTVDLSLGIDGSSIILKGDQLALGSMGANTVGQVLKWNGASWAAGDDLNTIIDEVDPKVRSFAHKDQAAPPICAAHETLNYDPDSENFTCKVIEFSGDQLNTVITAAVEDLIQEGIKEVAPSQDAVYKALALKQDKILIDSDIEMRSLSLTSNGITKVNIAASPSTVGILPFILPPNKGSNGYVLKTDGDGNLSWGSPTAGVVTGINTTDPLTSSGTGSVTLSLKDGGITNTHISDSAAIAWSKINSTGVISNTDIDIGANIDASKLGTGIVDNTEFNFLDGVTSSIQTQLTNLSNRFPAGSTTEYVRGDNTLATLNTAVVPEDSSNLYFTYDRVRETSLSGLSLTNSAITSADNVLSALGKIQGQISAKGQWDKNETSLYYNDGSIGIGTSDPSAILEVKSSIGGGLHNILKVTSDNDDSFLSIYDNASSPAVFAPSFLGVSSTGSSLQFIGGMDPSLDLETELPLITLQGRNGDVTGETVVNRDILGIQNYSTPLLRVKADGKIGVGTTSPATTFHVVSKIPESTLHPMRAGLSVEGEGAGPGGRIASTTYSNNQYPVFIGYRARGSKALLESVKANDILLAINGAGFDGTNWVNSSGQGIDTLRYIATQDWTPTARGSKLIFSTTPNDSNSGAVRMMIDQSGSIGVGTQNPTGLMHIHTSHGGTIGGASSQLNMAGLVISNADNQFLALDGNEVRQFGTGDLVMSGETGVTVKVGNYTAGTELQAMRVIADGRVGIGTNSPSDKLHVAGIVRGTDFIKSSDIRYKKNIEEIPDSLEKLLHLRGVTYDWRTNEFSDNGFKQTRDMGVIAQEVKVVFPEAVLTDEDGFLSVSYSELVAPLINAIKELYAMIMGHDEKLNSVSREIASVRAESETRIKQLEAENAQLKKENEAIKERLEKIEKALNLQ